MTAQELNKQVLGSVTVSDPRQVNLQAKKRKTHKFNLSAKS